MARCATEDTEGVALQRESQACHSSESTLMQTAPLIATERDHPMTLANLQSSLCDVSVGPSECMRDVIERLRTDDRCVGVLVLDGSDVVGVVSREMLARELARPFYRELCERRPVIEFLRLSPQSRLELPLETGISQAVEASLSRPVAERYEPIIVAVSDNRRLLLDVPILLTAQCEALKATLVALEAQRAARQAAERERQTIHDQLVVASRQAGRAEVATGVLHNVGNVLNSVNVSATVIGRALGESKLPSLARVAALLKEHETDLSLFLTQDERGRRLPAFLEKLAETLSAEQTAVVEELRSLDTGLDHIKQVVQMQQSYARDHNVQMPVRPAELIEDALKVNLVSFERHNVSIDREFDDVPEVMLDKHKILQILINLISNAKNAVKMHQGSQKRICVAVSFDEAAQRVRFSVADTGVGIEPDALPRIFSHGFTTRKDGHGFGLHNSANAAREMGGMIKASSDGPGQGATFVLDVPVGKGAPA